MVQPIVIIGTGLSGYQLAREFRKLDSQSPLVLITADDGRFYSKPLLSTALTQKKTSETLAVSSAPQMAEQLNATILNHTTIKKLLPLEKKILWAGHDLAYEKLILAWGADVLKAPLAGNAVDEVLAINHIYHYSMFESLIKNKRHVTILGMGLIGCEFANDLSNVGYKVDMVAPCKAPLDLLLPLEIGQVLQKALAEKGVNFHFDTTAKEINKSDDGYEITLATGETFKTDFILSAIGLKPHIALAVDAGLCTNRGIVVNRFLETSHSDIYALGDCAEVEGHVLPYITPLLNSARALAKTLSGVRTAVDYPAMPVTVKTPAHPLVICPPPKNMQGKWTIESNNNSVRALFYNNENQLFGFVLSNEAVKERSSLAKLIPPFFN